MPVRLMLLHGEEGLGPYLRDFAASALGLNERSNQAYIDDGLASQFPEAKRKISLAWSHSDLVQRLDSTLVMRAMFLYLEGRANTLSSRVRAG